MTTVTTELARHVASNPDGCDDSDLEAFVEYVGDGRRPLPQAAAIFPDAGGSRTQAVLLIRDYCRRLLRVRRLRREGSIARALNLENLNDYVYHLIPYWARW